MLPSIRRWALVFLAAGFSLLAHAQYPDKPIKIIVPYPPGGTTDLLARSLAPRLSERLNQPVLIDNRAGAGGVIGSQVVAKSPADGYTLVFGSIASHGILPAVQNPPPYDPLKDFAPISLAAMTPNVLLANVASPFKSLSELIQMARSKPGELNFGSTSLGGSPHMSGELLKSLAKIDMVHVPYKGGAPMLVDLIGGQVPIAFDNLPSSIQHIRSGKVRALAVTTSKRWPGAPEIPTMAEAGLPNYESSAWFGLFAPGATPKPVVELLQRHVTAILKQPDFEKLYLEQGAMPVGNTSEEFAKFIAGEMVKWRTVVNDTGVKLN
jgi:tripartite-type tricarboxylate transporter receptor subunit TctC